MLRSPSASLASALVALSAFVAAAYAPAALGREVIVSTASALRAAVEGAEPGDVILLESGTYDVQGNVRASAAGSAAAPIVVRASTPLEARIRFNAVEGFLVSGPHWTFEGLDIEGVCADHSDCEHAFHIVGAADFTVIRGNRVHGFNAHIKANGTGTPRVFPDDVLIENNEFFNETPRATGNPVTPIDVVGGRRWIVRGNFIHDHQKGGGDGVSYAAFLKGNSRDGLIERNLVICELLHTGGTRLGLSFGGGGTSPDSICEDGTCSPEHQNGILRNNIVVNCPADVGIYVNECANCLILHNTVFGTTGIDVRYAASVVDARGNVLSGPIRARNSATVNKSGNLEQVSNSDFLAWFADPAAADFSLVDGTALVDVGSEPTDTLPDDFCGNPRADGAPDLGAVEYGSASPCDTTSPGVSPPAEDAGVVGTDDAGSDETDAGPNAPDASSGTDAGSGDESDDEKDDERDDERDDDNDGEGQSDADAGDEVPREEPPIDDESGCACASAEGGAPAGGMGVMLATLVALLMLRALVGLGHRSRRSRLLRSGLA